MSWANDYDEQPDSDDDRYAFRPATLGQRFLGVLIDGFFNVAILYVTRSLMNGAPPTSLDDLAGARAMEEHGVAALIGTLVPLGITAWLISTRGQSVGKMLVGTRIVDETGRRAGLLHGFVLRTLPFVALGSVLPVLQAMGTRLEDLQPLSLLLGLVSLLDAGLILGAYRRCLHDRIAGTFVAVVGTERPPRDEAARRPRKKKRRKAVPADNEDAVS